MENCERRSGEAVCGVEGWGEEDLIKKRMGGEKFVVPCFWWQHPEYHGEYLGKTTDDRPPFAWRHGRLFLQIIEATIQHRPLRRTRKTAVAVQF